MFPYIQGWFISDFTFPSIILKSLSILFAVNISDIIFVYLCVWCIQLPFKSPFSKLASVLLQFSFIYSLPKSLIFFNSSYYHDPFLLDVSKYIASESSNLWLSLIFRFSWCFNFLHSYNAFECFIFFEYFSSSDIFNIIHCFLSLNTQIADVTLIDKWRHQQFNVIFVRQFFHGNLICFQTSC